MQKKYTIDYFIREFAFLHDEYLKHSSDPDQLDIWEWIATREEEDALYEIIEPYGVLLAANDGIGGYKLLGHTPKQRVLRFLTYVKKRIEDNEKVLQSLSETSC